MPWCGGGLLSFSTGRCWHGGRTEERPVLSIRCILPVWCTGDIPGWLVEGIRGCAACISQNAGHHAGYRIADDHGSQFAAGKHVVADRNELICQMFLYPVVHAFIMTADEHQVVVVPLKFLGFVLVKGLSCR